MRLVVFLFVLGFFLIPSHLSAQESCWVYLQDKEGVRFNPHTYFDQKTIQRRRKHGIPLDQYTDRPVKEDYIKSLKSKGAKIISVSRWLNAVLISEDNDRIKKIETLPFVTSVQRANKTELKPDSFSSKNTTIPDGGEDLMHRQLDRFGVDALENSGIDGEGIRIAVFDAGFTKVNENPFFQHLFESGRIKGTYDFIKDREEVYGKSSHGTMVLSCIAGKSEDKKLGLATGAEFLLARTEYNFLEPFSEEANWFEAMEWADKNGADIISSSLGYTYKRYFKQDMNGRSSLVSKAARIAASKGMLVLVSMGNDGSSRWKVLGTPADADSILSIGGLSPKTGIHTPFSSYGPTVDMRMKPNLTAFGHVLAASPVGLIKTQGTSFSTPLVAGFAACIWQMHPEWSNMKLLDELCKSGDLYPYYDYAHGYGVPQASYFLGEDDRTIGKKLNYNVTENYVEISFGKLKEIETWNYPYLFYHIADPDGVLIKYAVIEPERDSEFKIPLQENYKGYKIRIHFAGSTREILIQ